MYGIVNGSVAVERGGVLALYGIVRNELFVAEGAQAHLHGVVAGVVLNKGTLNVYGVVGWIAQEGGSTYVHPDAIVEGVRSGVAHADDGAA